MKFNRDRSHIAKACKLMEDALTVLDKVIISAAIAPGSVSITLQWTLMFCNECNYHAKPNNFLNFQRQYPLTYNRYNSIFNSCRARSVHFLVIKLKVLTTV